jgi:hypothetical protein
MFSRGLFRLIRAVCPLILVLSLAFIVPRSRAQAKADSSSDPSMHSVAAASESPSQASGAPEGQIPPAIAKELEAMKARIAQLEAELKARAAAPVLAPAAAAPAASAAAQPLATAVATVEVPQQPPQPSAPPKKAPPSEPFAYADWTWLNGTPRNKDVVWDSKFFTPEVRFDTHFVHSFNGPRDDSLGGSTEIFRNNEIQVEQISVGGDFHWQNVRGRILTMNGMFGVTTPRNDASAGRGQWDLRGAYKYVSEAYGGYHFNVNHGLNIDAGIFVSYIGLFSYYNFDNWAYQPSFVSSNTPWFFNGLRIQWFPTDKLKIEPWIINGWQSYGRYGSKPGLGGQVLWRPKSWVSLVFNNYGMGEDTLGTTVNFPKGAVTFGVPGQNGAGRSRIHTDDSIEVKYYDRPKKFLDKMAFSLTGDLGCEYGAGVSCHGHTVQNGNIWPQQSFAGWMLYNRWWFKNDRYAITVGYGAMNNPGRYLTLLPPINGADALYGSPYFPTGPYAQDPRTGATIQQTQFKGWDSLITFDWMPRQYITFRSEFGYRHADQPYWSGPGGITPPGGNSAGQAVGAQPLSANFVCSNGTNAATSSLAGALAACGANGGIWYPDLRKDEPSLRFAIMVKF